VVSILDWNRNSKCCDSCSRGKEKLGGLMQSISLAKRVTRKEDEKDYWRKWTAELNSERFGVQLRDVEEEAEWLWKTKGGQREGVFWEG
jgi:hypothetical protein